MRLETQISEDRYEIVIKKVGASYPIEIDVLGDSQTQVILRVIGLLNLRSAQGEVNEGCS